MKEATMQAQMTPKELESRIRDFNQRKRGRLQELEDLDIHIESPQKNRLLDIRGWFKLVTMAN